MQGAIKARAATDALELAQADELDEPRHAHQAHQHEHIGGADCGSAFHGLRNGFVIISHIGGGRVDSCRHGAQNELGDLSKTRAVAQATRTQSNLGETTC